MRCPLVLAAIASAAGCTDLGLDPPSIVRTPRILAIVAEPPESAPGTDVELRALVSVPDEAPRPLALHWRVCLDLESVLSETGFPIDLPGRPQCDEATLPEGEPFRVDGTRTEALVANVRTLAELGGFDARVFETVLATAGFAFVVDVDVLDAEANVLVSGYKRAAVTTRASVTTNPPAPSVRFGEALVVATEEPFVCEPVGGARLRAEVGERVELAPALPDDLDEEPWLETFPVFDYTGGITEGRENAYYSWFATGGSISAETTRPPERAVTWTAPQQAGAHTMWLVVRDGHLGTSACRWRVDVVAPEKR